MQKFKIGLLALCFCFLQQESKAQYVIEALPRYLFSWHLTLISPQKSVERFLDHNALGYHLELQYRLQYNKPFLAGIYYSESTLSRYALTYIDHTVNGGLEVKEKANTRRLEAGLTAGFYPEINWLLQPYIQGRLGLGWFLSASVLTDQDANELIERIKEKSTFVSSYGLDVGVHIVPNIWYIRGDLRIGVVANPSVDFLSLNDAYKGTVQYPIEAFQEHTSSAQWLKVSVGMSYLF